MKRFRYNLKKGSETSSNQNTKDKNINKTTVQGQNSKERNVQTLPGPLLKTKLINTK